MNILFATTSLPHGRTTGAEIASQDFIDAMRAAGHQVTVLGFARDAAAIPDSSISAEIRAIETASAGAAKYDWLARSLVSGQPYVGEKFRSRRYREAFRQVTRLGRADVIVLDHAQMGWLLPLAQQFLGRLVFVAHNHEAQLYATEAKRRAWPQRLLLQRDSHLLNATEHRLAQAAHQVWTLSEHERSAFERMAGPGKTLLMPLPGRGLRADLRGAPQTFDIGLLGTWSWDVNGQGLAWFVRSVLPLLPSSLTVQIAGRGSDQLRGLPPNVTGLGFIEDASLFMASARVLAVPTLAGAGIQLKTIEAIASGTPVVSTSLGVRGLPHLPGYVAVADDAITFATALVRLATGAAPDRAIGDAWTTARQAEFQHRVTHALAQLNTRRSPEANPHMAAAL